MTQRRVVVLVVVAVFGIAILSGTTAAAVALPVVCPAGSHATGDPAWCTSDAQHIAPFSGVSIPVYTTQTHDLRLRLRIEIVLVGLAAVASLSLFGGRAYRRPAVDSARLP